MRPWVLGLALVACQATGPSAIVREPVRRTFLAQELNAKGADLIAREPEEAEALLRQALEADPYFGPAHNNLGVLHLAAGRLHEAASAFEWAGKLMPGNPDPRMNLALTLERAGKVAEAIDAYRRALEVSPGHVPTIQAVARLVVSSGREAPELAGWLDTILMQGETEAWREWARGQQARTRNR